MSDFSIHESVCVYTNIKKPNLFSDFYVWLLTNLHFPSNTVYLRFNYPLYRSIEESFIEWITNRLVTKNGEDVLFENSDIPCVVTLHFKKGAQLNRFQYASYNGYTRYYANQSSGGGGIGPVYRPSFRVQSGNDIGSFFRGLFRFVKSQLYSGLRLLENRRSKQVPIK